MVLHHLNCPALSTCCSNLVAFTDEDSHTGGFGDRGGRGGGRGAPRGGRGAPRGGRGAPRGGGGARGGAKVVIVSI